MSNITQHLYCIDENSLVYSYTGVISVTQTLIKCLQNINDPLMFPGYFNISLIPFVVKSQIALNNLILFIKMVYLKSLMSK